MIAGIENERQLLRGLRAASAPPGTVGSMAVLTTEQRELLAARMEEWAELDGRLQDAADAQEELFMAQCRICAELHDAGIADITIGSHIPVGGLDRTSISRRRSKFAREAHSRKT